MNIRREPHFSDTDFSGILDDMEAFSYVDRKLAQYGIDSASLDQEDLSNSIYACAGDKLSLKRLARVIAHQTRDEARRKRKRTRWMTIGLVVMVALMGLTFWFDTQPNADQASAGQEQPSSLWDNFSALLGLDQEQPEHTTIDDVVTNELPPIATLPDVEERELPPIVEESSLSLQSDVSGKARVVLSDEDLERLELQRQSTQAE